MAVKQDAEYLPKLISPKTSAVYAWLHKADTKFDDEGVYKITLLIDKKDHGDGRVGSKSMDGKAWVKTVLDWCKARGVAHKINTNGCPIKDGDLKTDKEGNPDESFTGFWYINTKRKISKGQPKLVDSKSKPLPANVEIRSGDLVRVGIQPVYREISGNHFLSMYLEAVQLIEKRSGGGDFEFGEEEGGFVAPEDTTVDFGSDEDNSGNGDF